MSASRIFAAATAAAFLIFDIAAPAEAAACFKPSDIEADQAMRYQTELMLLDDTCGGDFYRDFTVRNREQIMSYQHQLEDYFRRIGAKSPGAMLDRFMTRVANELASRQGQELRQDMCAHSTAVIAQAKTIDATQFRALAAALAEANRGAYKACR